MPETAAAFEAVPGVRIEALGEFWAAFSPASGESHLLNDESALVLSWLAEHGPADARQVARQLADDVGLPHEDLTARVDLGWGALIDAGLVRHVRCRPPEPAQ